jgi:hypothetical protein
MTKHYPKGLDERQRDADGEIRRKRGDTKIGKLRQEYGFSFAEGVRSDARLDTVLKRTGASSLSELLKIGTTKNK